MNDTDTPQQRDMTHVWEGNRRRRRRRLASELGAAGYLARPLETDPVPDAPGVYLSDTISEDSRFTAAGAEAVGLWMRALLSPDRAVIDGHAVIPRESIVLYRNLDALAQRLIESGLWQYDRAADRYVFTGPGQVYAIVGGAE